MNGLIELVEVATICHIVADPLFRQAFRIEQAGMHGFSALWLFGLAN